MDKTIFLLYNFCLQFGFISASSWRKRKVRRSHRFSGAVTYPLKHKLNSCRAATERLSVASYSNTAKTLRFRMVPSVKTARLETEYTLRIRYETTWTLIAGGNKFIFSQITYLALVLNFIIIFISLRLMISFKSH